MEARWERRSRKGRVGVYEGVAEVRSRRPILPAPRWDPGDPTRQNTAINGQRIRHLSGAAGEALQARMVVRLLDGPLASCPRRESLEAGRASGTNKAGTVDAEAVDGLQRRIQEVAAGPEAVSLRASVLARASSARGRPGNRAFPATPPGRPRPCVFGAIPIGIGGLTIQESRALPMT